MKITTKTSRAPVKLARKAIAEFVESNIPRFNGWLEQVAGGIPQYDKDGVVQLDSKGCPIWLVKPDPATAMKLVGDLTEYHLPKLSRADVQVAAKVESVRTVENMTNEELAAAILEGIWQQQQEPVDVEFEEVERVPEWLENPTNS